MRKGELKVPLNLKISPAAKQTPDSIIKRTERDLPSMFLKKTPLIFRTYKIYNAY